MEAQALVEYDWRYSFNGPLTLTWLSLHTDPRAAVFLLSSSASDVLRCPRDPPMSCPLRLWGGQRRWTFLQRGWSDCRHQHADGWRQLVGRWSGGTAVEKGHVSYKLRLHALGLKSAVTHLVLSGCSLFLQCP